jgi:hypothetical protein
MASIGKDKAFLQCFWDLASEDSATRIAASESAVAFVKNNLEAETDYALKRLVKGLGSSRDSARQGFATCLCEILQIKSVKIVDVLEVLDANTMVRFVSMWFL